MNAPVNIDPREDAWSLPLDKIDVSQPRLYQDDIWQPYFERLRQEDPVHWCENGMYGSYWSVTRYHDIMQVDTNQKVYSSDAMMGGIVLRDAPMDFRRPSFISMDQPKHDEQRKVVSPVVAPGNLQRLSGTIRERTQRVLDELPRGEDVRLGGSRVDRADHADARHAVRLPVRGAAQAHLLVECRDGEHARRHRDRFGRKAGRRAAAGDGVLRRSLARAREAAAAPRPDFDAGARRGDTRSAFAAGGIHGQHPAAAGRRQRHHAELDVGRVCGRCTTTRTSIAS